MIEIPKFPELEFEENRHIYKLNGIGIPSVTTIMRPLSESYYGGINEAVMDRAAQRGTTVHNAIENYLKFGINDIEDEHAGYYEAFKAFWRDKSPILVSSENRAYHRVLRYAGTSDIVCVIGGRAMCVDVKTTAGIVEMLTRVQTEAYIRAYGSHKITFDGKAILHLQSDGSYEFDDKYALVDAEAWDAFCSLLTVRNYITKHRR